MQHSWKIIIFRIIKQIVWSKIVIFPNTIIIIVIVVVLVVVIIIIITVKSLI